jgi:hypothetical protein
MENKEIFKLQSKSKLSISMAQFINVLECSNEDEELTLETILERAKTLPQSTKTYTHLLDAIQDLESAIAKTLKLNGALLGTEDEEDDEDEVEKEVGTKTINFSLIARLDSAKYLCDKFGVTAEELQVLLVCLEKGMNNSSCYINDVVRRYKLNKFTGLKFIRVLDKLREKGFLLESSEDMFSAYGGYSYVVDNDLIIAIANNDLDLLPNKLTVKPINWKYIIQEIDSKFKIARRHNVEFKSVLTLFRELKKTSKNDFPFWITLDNYCMEEQLILLVCLNCYATNDNIVSLYEREFEFLFAYGSKLNSWNIESEFLDLQITKDGLVVESGHTEKEDDVFNISLTETGIRFFFGDAAPIQFSRKKKSYSVLTYPTSIPKKELYYDQKIKPEIDSIFELLSSDKSADLFNKMESLGMKKSISILLSGAPGTGKTETAYQLAKATDRPFFMVDISNIRDKWLGESEKNVKRIFNEYKAARVTSEITPILLINEADALLSRRITVERSVDQTYNAMQNIFLQAIEDFEGILVATTNLVGNLDTAFDRRFLFKIHFDIPSSDVRKQIWQSHIPSQELAPILDKLATFPLSGGEIANIVKRYQLEILLGKAQGMDTLLSLASGETSVRKTNAIGFSK